MGKVTSIRIEGIDCWFYSQDHRPPHFHAKKRGEWHFKVWFLRSEGTMLERAKGPQGRITIRDKRLLQKMAALHRAELLKEWEQKVNYVN
jgi:hypothetical protein